MPTLGQRASECELLAHLAIAWCSRILSERHRRTWSAAEGLAAAHGTLDVLAVKSVLLSAQQTGTYYVCCCGSAQPDALRVFFPPEIVVCRCGTQLPGAE